MVGAQHVGALDDLQPPDASVPDVIANHWSVGAAFVFRPHRIGRSATVARLGAVTWSPEWTVRGQAGLIYRPRHTTAGFSRSRIGAHFPRAYAATPRVAMMRLIVAVGVVLLTVPNVTSAQARVEKNVVYGMYSGLALLMDVYRPAQPNGIAIVAIQGSGWYSPMRYDAAPLKANREVTRHAERFAAAGYTVFAINHRQAPRFRYPAPIEDAQRAVRFVRFHASDYGITSDRIGAWGSSSGGHLVELLGTMDGKGDASDSDPVNRLSAKVQAVVALFAPADLPSMFGTTSRPGTVSALMGFAYQDPSWSSRRRPA